MLNASTAAALWAVGVLNVPLLALAVAVAVLNDQVGCTGWACELATFGGRTWLLLGLSGGCVVGLVVSAVVTGGLTRAGAVPLGVMGVSGAAGLIAPLGVVAVAVIIVVVIACVLALLAVFAFFVDRF